MNYLIPFAAALVAISASSTQHSQPGLRESCDIDGFYEAQTVPSGTIALDSYEEAVEVDILLIPTEVEPGVYSVSVTREADDLYSMDGYNLYVKTSFCYEYAYGEDAVMKVQSHSGFTFGKLIFE